MIQTIPEQGERIMTLGQAADGLLRGLDLGNVLRANEYSEVDLIGSRVALLGVELTCDAAGPLTRLDVAPLPGIRERAAIVLAFANGELPTETTSTPFSVLTESGTEPGVWSGTSRPDAKIGHRIQVHLDENPTGSVDSRSFPDATDITLAKKIAEFLRELSEGDEANQRRPRAPRGTLVLASLAVKFTHEEGKTDEKAPFVLARATTYRTTPDDGLAPAAQLLGILRTDNTWTGHIRRAYVDVNPNE